MKCARPLNNHTERRCDVFFNDLPFPLALAALVCTFLCLSAFGCMLYRFIKGPSGFDRVVSLDLLGGICLCVIVLCAIIFEQQVLMEIAFAIAVVNFLGTIALAGYLGKEKD